MGHLTYDPVLDVQDLSWLRMLTPLRPPSPGRALVLVPHEGYAVTVRHGEEIPHARLGMYRQGITVDTTEHRLVLDMTLLSRDAAFAFRSQLALTCSVADPAEVVSRGIRDMSGALFDPIRRMLRSVSRHYDIADFHEAESALNREVRDLDGDRAVRLRNLHVELVIDPDEAAASGRAYRDLVRDTRLDGMRRQRHLDMMRADGVEGLLAEIMEREGPRAALDWIERAESNERDELMKTFKLVLERGDADREPFESADIERALVDRILSGSDAPFGGTRMSRVRGRGLPRPLAEGAAARPVELAGEARSLPGEVVSQPPAAPPEDEPLPGERPPAEDRPPTDRRYDPRSSAGATAASSPADQDGAAKMSRVRGSLRGSGRKNGDDR
ncbi:hypothetical protein [Streptacidiphilus sp. MAP5-3]|uniref:hypothetical protein n=1 Tax=unclassified Streptacidiphilus TaxID=2643834 RepID=UPI0035171FCF